MKFFPLLLLLLLTRTTSCTEEQLTGSRLAENNYLDLISFIEHDQRDSAVLAAEALESALVKLREKWRRPMSRARSQLCRSHLNEAEKKFTELKTALRENNLAVAKVLLDYAMNELDAADHESFIRLYTGRIFDFSTTWLEVDMIVNDQMLCLMEWHEYVWWANLARSEWQRVECEEPDMALYNFNSAEQLAFNTTRSELSAALDAFARNISRGDQCSSQEYAAVVTDALWTLMMSVKVTVPAVENTVLD